MAATAVTSFMGSQWRRGAAAAAYAGWPPGAYRDSMMSAYLAVIAWRLSFMVGVSSPPPGSQDTGRMANGLICSTRDSLPFAFCTAAVTAARTAGCPDRAAGVGSAMPCRAAQPAAASGVEHDQRGDVRPP